MTDPIPLLPWALEEQLALQWLREVLTVAPSERHKLAIHQCFDAVLRLLWAKSRIQEFRLTLPVGDLSTQRKEFARSGRSWDNQVLETNDPLSLQQKNVLFYLTEMWFLGFYATLGSFASLMPRFSEVFGRDVPIANISRFIGMLGPRYPHLPVEFLEEAHEFRTWLTHPEAKPVYTWGVAFGDTPHHVFLHSRPHYGKVPRGSMTEGFHKVPDQWSLTAPDEEWVMNTLGLLLMLVVDDILGTNTSFKSMHKGASMFTDDIDFYIPKNCRTRWQPEKPIVMERQD